MKTLEELGFIYSSSIIRREDFGKLLNLRGLDGFGVEIGTHLGEFAEHVLLDWNGKKLACIDPWLNDLDGYDGVYIDQRNRNEDYAIAQARLARFGQRVDFLRMTSEQAANHFGNGTLEFVYLDGNHNEQYVRKDIELWWPKMRSRGVFAGHDANGDWGDNIQNALVDFQKQSQVTIHFVLGEAASWFCFKP